MIAPRDDSNAFPITEAQLTGHYFETLGYGMYLVTCFLCAHTLFWIPQPGGGERLRRRSEIQWLLVSVFSFLFVISTFDDIIGLVHIILAFVKYKGQGGATEELTNIHEWINIVRSFDQIGIMIVGDFVLIYRCFVVYGRRWSAIAVSFVLYLAGIAMGIKLMDVEITTSNATITLNSSVIKPWWSAFFAITAAQNVLTTCKISTFLSRSSLLNYLFQLCLCGAYGVSSTEMKSSEPRGTPHSPLPSTNVDSASNTLYPVADAALQATGITFNVIIIRSTPRRDDEFTNFDRAERGITSQAEGWGVGRVFNGSGFISHATADQGKTTERVNINVTIKSTTEGLDDGESQVDTYSMQDVAAK
ncbi:hypothetical protein MSAN_00299800 [Mycena sanguinolenta]|uniref:Uncharacterized protein n=1 Tax=Mycena sanguinolenta TaxID=230812 RepID=A0A8H6ZEI9_9AGAR|nr:hypothetical protein MSAN_00299800 [Mycena sanguinolenta]